MRFHFGAPKWKLVTIMTQESINQRIKFLVDTLSPSARAFSEAIKESPTNTFNYIGGRLVEPRAEYLEKIIRHFGNISAHWLLTGEGEPFLSQASNGVIQTGNLNQAGNNNIQKIKGNKGNVIGNNLGTATQNSAARDDYQRDLLIAQKENELLRSQLADKERTIQILLNQSK